MIVPFNLASQTGDDSVVTDNEVEDESLLPLEDAAPAVIETPEGEIAPRPSAWDYIRTLLVLGLVVGMIYLLFYFLKKNGQRNLPSGNMIKVLSSRKLQGNSSLHLVEVGTGVYLIGAGENNVNLVSEIRDKESIDTIRLQSSEQEGTEKKGFADLLGKLLKPTPLKKVSEERIVKNEEMGIDSINFIKNQKDRLKKM